MGDTSHLFGLGATYTEYTALLFPKASPIDGRTDGPTDRPTDTDRPGYRDARTSKLQTAVAIRVKNAELGGNKERQ